MSCWNCAVAEQVGPAVSHLADQVAPRQQHQHRGRGAHPPLVLLRQGALEDGVVGGADGGAHPLAGLFVGQARGASRSGCEVIRTAISLATSPAAWPPMPSATMKMPRSASMR